MQLRCGSLEASSCLVYNCYISCCRPNFGSFSLCLVLSVCLIVSTWYLLNCSLLYQTWHDSVLSWGDVSCRKIGSLCWMSRSQEKVQNVSECLSGWYFLRVSDRVRSISPELLNYLFIYFFTKLGIVVYYRVMQKNWFTMLNVKVTARVYMINMWLFFTIFSKLLVRLQTNLVW